MTGGSHLFVFLVVYTCALPKITFADNSSDPYITPRCVFARQDEEINFICCLSMQESDCSLHFKPLGFPQSSLNDSCTKLTLNTSSLGNTLVTNVTCFKVPGFRSSGSLLLLQDVLDVNISETYNDTHVRLGWQPVDYTREYIIIVKNIFSSEVMSTNLKEMFFPRPCGSINIEIQVNISDGCIGVVYTGMQTLKRTTMNLDTTSDFRIAFSDNNKISACLNVLKWKQPTKKKLCLEPYNITLLNSKKDTVHRDTRPWAEFSRIPGNDFTAEVCIPPQHLQYNEHYMVQLDFDTDTLQRNFSTFDVQEVTVNASIANELTICCKYAKGSRAEGCHIEIQEKEHDLSKNEDCHIFKELEGGEYEILVWDIEEDTDSSTIYSKQSVAWREKIFVAESKAGDSGKVTDITVVAVLIPVALVIVALVVAVLIVVILLCIRKKSSSSTLEGTNTTSDPNSLRVNIDELDGIHKIKLQVQPSQAEVKGPRRRH